MQPGATNITVQFHLPSYECVFKAPKLIRSVFSGEKLVVYGIFKCTKKESATLQGRATLKYTICGKEATVEVPFVVLEQVPVIPVVHHLAAKQRLLEFKGSGSHQVMVNLSIESSVVCPQTAFFAVDETSQQPVFGSIKTYDLYSMEPEFDLLCSTPAARSCYCAISLLSADDLSDDDECEEDLFDPDELNNLPPIDGAAFWDSVEFNNSSKSSQVSSLSSLVALQLANGSWSLTGALSSKLGKALKVVEDSCPSGCLSAVWATALALSSLKLTYSSQQDEWELVAKKAGAWLKKLSLPTGLTLQSLHSEAEKFNKILVSF